MHPQDRSDPAASTTPVVTLEFGHSRSPCYAAAVRLVAGLPGYQSEGEGREVVHRLPIGPASFAALDDLLPLVVSWKSARVRLDGIPVFAGTYRLQRIVGCFQERCLTDLGDLHCRDVVHGGALPCRLLSETPLARGELGWVTVQRLVEGQARGHLIVACPAWDPEALGEAVRYQLGLPDQQETDRLTRLVGDLDLDAL